MLAPSTAKRQQIRILRGPTRYAFIMHSTNTSTQAHSSVKSLYACRHIHLKLLFVALLIRAALLNTLSIAFRTTRPSLIQSGLSIIAIWWCTSCVSKHPPPHKDVLSVLYFLVTSGEGFHGSPDYEPLQPPTERPRDCAKQKAWLLERVQYHRHASCCQME